MEIEPLMTNAACNTSPQSYADILKDNISPDKGSAYMRKALISPDKGSAYVRKALISPHMGSTDPEGF